MSELDLDSMQSRATAGFRDGAGQARDDALALVAEVRRLRQQVATLESGIREIANLVNETSSDDDPWETLGHIDQMMSTLIDVSHDQEEEEETPCPTCGELPKHHPPDCPPDVSHDQENEWWRCPHCGDRERIEGLEPGESPGLHSCDIAEMVPGDDPCSCGKPSGAEHYCETLNRIRTVLDVSHDQENGQ